MPSPHPITLADLISFEDEVAAAFNASRIRAPIHLSGGNERQLIDYFAQHVRQNDWVAITWRSHYHALLAGVPRDELMAAILAGRSITLCFPKHRVISSAIVGGVLPIAVGLALGSKRRGDGARVHAFVGDMTARTGAYHEAYQYAKGYGLRLNFIIEDNGRSVGTPTAEVWGTENSPPHVTHHPHDNPWPHAGAGVHVLF